MDYAGMFCRLSHAVKEAEVYDKTYLPIMAEKGLVLFPA